MYNFLFFNFETQIIFFSFQVFKMCVITFIYKSYIYSLYYIYVYNVYSFINATSWTLILFVMFYFKLINYF